MAKAFTEGFMRKKFEPITLVVETPQEAYALEQLLGESTGNSLQAVDNVFDKEYDKQKEVIENAVSRHGDD